MPCYCGGEMSRFLYFFGSFTIVFASKIFADLPADMRLPDTFSDKYFKDVPAELLKQLHDYLASPGERTRNDIDKATGRVEFRSFRKLEDSGYAALGFQGYIDIPFQEAVSIWFANSRKKTQFMEHCQEFIALKATPLTKLENGIFTFNKTVLFRSEPMFIVWSRLFFTDNVIVVHSKERWVGGIAFANRNPEEFMPGVKDIDNDNKTVTAGVIVASSMIKEEKNGVWVNFSAYVNPNGKVGKIPRFIANNVAASWPISTRDKLIELVKSHPNEFEVIDFFNGKYNPQNDIEKITIETKKK